jgi:hypothetical protein
LSGHLFDSLLFSATAHRRGRQPSTCEGKETQSAVDGDVACWGRWIVTFAYWIANIVVRAIGITSNAVIG